MLSDTIELSPFEVLTCPAPVELGGALEGRTAPGQPILRLRFAEVTAGLPISDVWSACCELILQAELVRERKLNRFVLDLEEVFDVSCTGAVVLCRFSAEHVFVVSREEFASALERVVDQIFAGTSCPALMHVAARWGASAIRALPYSHRFSDFMLM
jgi:hypothetical protein